MRALSILICSFLILGTTMTALASGLDAADEQALQDTRSLLTNTSLRQKALQGNSKGTGADATLRNAVGSENMQEAYALSADIMETMVRQTNGDPTKLQALIEEAMKNPAAFAEKFTPDQKAKLKSLANKAGNRSPSPSAR